mgnify:FL=1
MNTILFDLGLKKRLFSAGGRRFKGNGIKVKYGVSYRVSSTHSRAFDEDPFTELTIKTRDERKFKELEERLREAGLIAQREKSIPLGPPVMPPNFTGGALRLKN